MLTLATAIDENDRVIEVAGLARHQGLVHQEFVLVGTVDDVEVAEVIRVVSSARNGRWHISRGRAVYPLIPYPRVVPFAHDEGTELVPVGELGA